MHEGFLGGIVRFSLRFRGLVIALACALLGYGLHTLGRARYDVFPEFAPPQVTIQTEAPGLSPEQVETLVTQPIENVVNGIDGVGALRSSSIQGLSLLTLTFRPDSDIHLARQSVSERLGTLTGRLPQSVASPVMTPLTSSASIVFEAGLTSTERTAMEVRTFADWTLKPRLLTVDGVANVSVFGGEVKQLQIQVIPEQLVRHDLSLEDVVAVASKATGVQGAGFIENANQRIVIQTEAQEALTPAQLAAVVVARKDGAVLTLGDVARVVEAPEPPFGAASIMGRPGVVLVISSQFGTNTLEVTRKVEAALAELRPSLARERIGLHDDLFRPAAFIETATHNVAWSLLTGGVLVVVVLLLFLNNLRTAAISCTAIPLSLLAAVIVLEKLGCSLNTMTLGGLAIAIGEVVDDAVIDVENILRRLRGNRTLESPRPVWQVVIEASLEVRSAVVHATFAVILVFLPVLSMTGIAGRLFSPLGIAYVSAIAASLGVALTLTPALALVFLGKCELSAHEAPLARWMKARYLALLAWLNGSFRTVITVVVLVTLGGIAMLPLFQSQLVPELREGHFIVHMAAVPGTSLAQARSLGDDVTRELLKLPFVRKVNQRIGRTEASDDTFGSHEGEFDVELRPLEGDAAEGAVAEVRSMLEKFPGVNFAVKSFLSERVEETLSGYTAPVAIHVRGNDLDVLDGKAEEIAKLLHSIRGGRDVRVQSPQGTPQLVIRPRPSDLVRWGFTPGDVLTAVRTAYQGMGVGEIYEGNQVHEVNVILPPELRKDISSVGELVLKSPTGVHVPLRQLADIRQEAGRYVVLHRDARRVQTVTCDVEGRDVAGFVDEARKRIGAEIMMLSGTYVEFSGTAQEQARSRRDLMVHSTLAGLGIVLLLSIVTRHFRNLLLILANLPFALCGGVVAVFACGGLLSTGAMVGFVTLFGITLRNSIMLISHYEHLVTVERHEWNLETAWLGAGERLVPILMTALVTALGLLPLAIGTGDPGREIEGPMAIVILGGLLSSTSLNLLVLPMLAHRFGCFYRETSYYRS
ncbi:efflux RND transporter permease subunit [Luteolibacter ambystomatis]|uniref:Efflux RND transporter permease subunit n=1 Tax=Luteolibacter ambystomatis TaxID=2824561 RepID=A0A975J3F9_9BACT|nr:efflux RND transporter permease subunit [Luteolibacter ambystomatis]QUE53241.1 efflux RND transporter permease subunit [Luteolibacter ambystomatis]